MYILNREEREDLIVLLEHKIAWLEGHIAKEQIELTSDKQRLEALRAMGNGRRSP
jgi:hypothetical protein